MQDTQRNLNNKEREYKNIVCKIHKEISIIKRKNTKTLSVGYKEESIFCVKERRKEASLTCNSRKLHLRNKKTYNVCLNKKKKAISVSKIPISSSRKFPFLLKHETLTKYLNKNKT